jgi:hypothetical protein
MKEIKHATVIAKGEKTGVFCSDCGTKICNTVLECENTQGAVAEGGCVKWCICPKCKTEQCCKRKGKSLDLDKINELSV